MDSRFDLRNTTRGKTPRIPFEKIGRRILGTRYSISLVVCGDTISQRLNRTYRNKTYKPNVLSFPISRTEGEIFLNVRKAEREAKRYGVSAGERATLLFIHACLHLKGLNHGEKMDKLELHHLKEAGF